MGSLTPPARLRFPFCACVLAFASWLAWSRAAVAQANQPPSAVVAGIDAYNRGDVTTAYALLKAEADRGDSDAEVNLGYLYARGQGVAMDQREAFHLYDLSAQQDNGEGMNALGYKYQFGTGIKPDIDAAIRWYCSALHRGNPRAMNNLALMLADGKDVPRDAAAARDLWQQSINHGDINAMVNLGLSLVQSPSQPSDKQAGTQLIIDAANRGQAGAERILRRSGYTGPLPPIIDFTGQMKLQPRDAAPGHADICGSLIS
jgi:TPR repeat protein